MAWDASRLRRIAQVAVGRLRGVIDPGSSDSLMLEWLVIGGGPHGVHAALRLVEEGGVMPEAVRILDDAPHLMARWRQSTRNTGMRYLRSPSVHHVGLSAPALDRFAKGKGRTVRKPFTRPYSRPALELFDLHCDDLIARHGLESLHVRGRVNRLDFGAESVRVGFEDRADCGGSRELSARRVILAIGSPREPAWPDWARDVAAAAEPDSASRIRHVFDPGFELVDDENDADIAVIGAGITGAQVALRLARKGRRVTLISRQELRIEQFDSDPGWQGPKNMAAFSRLRDPDERRERIRAARHRGSMPPDVHTELRQAVGEGRIELLEERDVRSAQPLERAVSLELAGKRIRADRVLLATGFPARRPGGAWLDEAASALQLPCATCGYPIIDRGLRWHPRILVTGALAELELGPVSRNLSGAQRAGERIVAVARGRRSRRSRR